MNVKEFYQRLIKLKEQAIPGLDNLEMTDAEFGPWCTGLSEINASSDGVELVFGGGKEKVRIDEVIERFKSLLETIPTAKVVRMYKGMYVPITKVYEDVPVFVIECYDPSPR